MRPQSRYDSKLLVIVTVILALLHTAFLVFAACRNAPVHDEGAHLVAALDHLQRGSFDMYRVNPPLVKYFVAIPLLMSDYENTLGPHDQRPGMRTAWKLGEKFFERNREKAFTLLLHARFACIPFSLVGLLVCVVWAYQMYSCIAAMLTGALWAFSPTVLGNACLITPDVAATAMGLLAGYAFWKFLESPTLKLITFAGFALGLALLAKMTWIVAFPAWLAATLAVWPEIKKNLPSIRFQELLFKVMLIFLLALYCLNLGYGFEGSFKRLGDYRFVSQALTGGSRLQFHRVGGNRFADGLLATSPVPLPRNWLLGIDEQRVDFEVPSPAFMRGEWQSGGWYHYYLYALLVKEPAATVVVVIAAILTLGAGRVCAGEKVAMIAASSVLLLISSQTNLNQHYRYALPALGFLYIFAGRFTMWLTPRWQERSIVLIVVLIAAESISVSPYFGSFFNFAAGGPSSGRRHLAHSAVDWGQGLFALRDWQREHPEAYPLHLAWAGYVKPEVAGIDYVSFPKTSVTEKHITMDTPLEPGYYAINMHTLHQPDSPYRWIDQFTPEFVVAYNVFVYHLSESDIVQLDDVANSGGSRKPNGAEL